MVRSFALAHAPLALAPIALIACASQKSETAEPTSTTTTTSAALTTSKGDIEAYDPSFRVADSIYEQCQLASRGTMTIVEGTSYCMKSGPLMDRRIRIIGSKQEVDQAKMRLLGKGIDASRITTQYSDGPAYVEIVQELPR